MEGACLSRAHTGRTIPPHQHYGALPHHLQLHGHLQHICVSKLLFSKHPKLHAEFLQHRPKFLRRYLAVYFLIRKCPLEFNSPFTMELLLDRTKFQDQELWDAISAGINPFVRVLSIDGLIYRSLTMKSKRFLAEKFV